MATINISGTITLDIENYTQGDTFVLELEFFDDDKGLVPEDVSALKFFMDIQPSDSCGNSTQDKETLSTDTGEIVMGTTTNDIVITKKLTSPPGLMKQSLRSVDALGVIKTREDGTLQIKVKI